MVQKDGPNPAGSCCQDQWRACIWVIWHHAGEHLPSHCMLLVQNVSKAISTPLLQQHAHVNHNPDNKASYPNKPICMLHLIACSCFSRKTTQLVPIWSMNHCSIQYAPLAAFWSTAIQHHPCHCVVIVIHKGEAASCKPQRSAHGHAAWLNIVIESLGCNVIMQELEKHFDDPPLLPSNSELQEEVEEVCKQASG